MEGALEVRAVSELRTLKTGTLEGYAVLWDAVSADMGGFTESVRRGAFARSLRDPDRILALYGHDRRSVLGRVGAGTLQLRDDFMGLFFEITLPATQTARDLAVLVERGDVHGASFAFFTRKGGEVWSTRDGKPHRELIDVDLNEITITADPAYADTSVARRHLQRTPATPRLNHARRFLELV